MTLIPTIYNADTLGIRPDLVGRPITNWKDLVDPAFKGKASILNIPSIGIMDAAMVMESLGDDEIRRQGQHDQARDRQDDRLPDRHQEAGPFRAFWKSFDESVNLMASGEVIIQSMWSPAVAAVRSQGIACNPAAGGRLSRLGRRPRHGQAPERLGTRRRLRIHQLVPVRLGRRLSDHQGYYSAVLETAKQNMSAEEWGYWMEGKPAQADILSPDGKVMEKAGAVRDGGSFQERMGKVACWNSVMDEDHYMVQKWNEFIAA